MTEPLSPSQHPNLDLIQELWESGLRSVAINQELIDRGYPPIKVRTLAGYGLRKWGTSTETTVEVNSLDEATEVIETFESMGMEVSNVTSTERTGWGWEKDESGKNVQVQRTSTTLTVRGTPPRAKIQAKTLGEPLRLAEVPNFNIVLSKAPLVKRASHIQTAFIMPDMQIGYMSDNRSTYLTTTHDEAAINVAHQLMARVSETYGINRLVYVGDNLDASGLSSHRTAPAYTNKFQLQIDRMGTEGAISRKIVGDLTDIDILAGNHEARLNNVLADRTPEILGLKRANSDEAVLSIDYLCRFSEYGINYHDSYPNSEVWLNENLRVIHGKLIGSKAGDTAVKNLVSGVSTIFGHTHRAELVWGTKLSQEGYQPIFAGTPGCLCRIDGSVPSVSVGVNSEGTQTRKAGQERWHQGVMVVEYDLDGKWASPTIIPIVNGKAVWRGEVLVSTVDSDGKLLAV